MLYYDSYVWIVIVNMVIYYDYVVVLYPFYFTEKTKDDVDQHDMGIILRFSETFYGICSGHRFNCSD